MNLKTKLISHTKHQLFANASQVFFGVISSVFFARALGPADFGRMQFVYWLIAIAGLLGTLGFNGTLSRFVGLYNGKKDASNVQKIISICFFTELLLAILITVLVFIFRGYIWGFFDEPLLVSSFWVLLLCIIPGCITDSFRFSLIGLQKIKDVSWFAVVSQFFSLILSVALILLGYGLAELFILNLIITCGKTLYLRQVLSRHIHISLLNFPDSELIRDLFKYNLLVAIIVISDEIIWQRSEIFFLQKFSTPEQIAFYSLAFGWGARLIGFLPGVLGGFLIPVMSELFGQNDVDRMEKSFYMISKYSSLVLIPLTFGFLSISKSFVFFLYGETYSLVPALMIPIFISKGYISLFSSASSVVFASGRQMFIVKSGLILAAVNLILDYFMIKEFDALGAAWATSIVHVMAAIITLVYIVKYMKMKVPYKFQVKLLVACTIAYFIVKPLSDLRVGFIGLFGGFILYVSIFFLITKFMDLFSSEDKDLISLIEKKAPYKLKNLILRFSNCEKIIKL